MLNCKIEITRWTEFLQKEAEEILKVKVMLAISAAKINNGTAFKDDFSRKLGKSYHLIAYSTQQTIRPLLWVYDQSSLKWSISF